MRGSAKVFVITGLTFVALLLMYYLPVMNVGGAQLRQVDVLADLDAFPDGGLSSLTLLVQHGLDGAQSVTMPTASPSTR